MSNLFKNLMKPGKKIIITLLFTMILIPAYASKKNRVYMSMDYKSVNGEYRLIEVSVRTRIDGKFYPLSNLPVEIIMDLEEGDTSLAMVYSDKEGKASFVIDKNYPLYKDEEGEFTLRARYNGNDTLRSAKKKVNAKDLKLWVDIPERDSVYALTINAIEIINDTSNNYPEPIDVEVFVDRMFSDLSIAEAEIENGKVDVEIPSDIPGDKEGKITLKIVVDERDYEVIELYKEVGWGIPLKERNGKDMNIATVSYVVFIILSIIIIAFVSLLLTFRMNNKPIK